MSDRSQISIQVMLASYNGGAFLRPQVESILAQEYVDVNILLRDDGSSDDSLKAISGLSDKISINTNQSDLKGHLANFSGLCLIALNEPFQYFAFSDQDDIWHTNKLITCIKRLHELENEHGSDTPILVHSDLRVVDNSLDEIAPSFIRFQGIPDPQEHSFDKFLHQNVATGCTFVFNRALLELATPVPEETVIHDWWFALVAKYYGIIDFIDQPLIDYRQHQQNAIGAISQSKQRSFFNSYLYRALSNFPKHLCAATKQANSLYELEGQGRNQLTRNGKKQLEQFKVLRSSGIFSRIAYVNHVIAKGRPFTDKLYLYTVLFLLPWMTSEK